MAQLTIEVPGGIPCARKIVKEWGGYVLEDFDFAEFEPGKLVLDVGCGKGTQLAELERRGCLSFGLEIGWDVLRECRTLGLKVLQGAGEQMPVRSESVDGVVCKGVLPYTNEVSALREINRVLKPGGLSHFCNLGAGYYLRYLLCGPSWKFRFYGLRTLVNTWLLGATGVRLPGFLGDTIYQSRRRLAKYYGEIGLKLLKDCPSPSFLGFPVFIYHSIQKVGD